ncbi:MAG: hypothetical protein ACLP59_17280 [Bryobacteraceae bacterium]
MLNTLAKRIRHDEEMLKNTTWSLFESAGTLLISLVALAAVCACILMLSH